MKGILLAGGTGSRLKPLTNLISKQLLPVYDKPMIYYPLSTLMLTGIREIMVISTVKDLVFIKDLLGDGSDLGIKLCYKAQDKPNGIAEAFLIAEDFIGNDNVALILGDNIFHMGELIHELSVEKMRNAGATVLAYRVNDPHRFGVVEFDSAHNVLSLEEKPKNPKSNYAVVGLYFYDNNVVKYTRDLKPSPRGELEITDLNQIYMEKKQLSVKLMKRGTAWIDAGTPQAFLEASNFVGMVEHRQGLKIGCPEEVAFRQKYINEEQVLRIAKKCEGSEYATYLRMMLEDK